MLGTQEAVHQGQRKERREEHRARRCNLVVSCTKSSVRSRDINGRPVVLKNNKLYINTGFATSLTEPSAHPFAGYFLPYPDTKYEGLVSTITNVAPILNWIYIDKDTYEVKYNVRAEAQPHLTGPFDCTRQDRRLTFESWEGFVAVEELPAVWALYFDRDDNALRGKVPRGTRVLEITLTRTERKRDKGDAEREKEEARQAREGLNNANANGDAGQAEKPATAVAEEPGVAQAGNDEVMTEEGGLHRSASMEREVLIQTAADNGVKPQKAGPARDVSKETGKTGTSNSTFSPKTPAAEEAGKRSTTETKPEGEALTHEQKGNLKMIERTLAKLSPFGALRSSKTTSTKDGTQEVRLSNKQEEKALSPQSTPAEDNAKDGLKSKEQISQITAVEKALKTLSPLAQLADLKKSEGELTSAAAGQQDDTTSSAWGEGSAVWSDQERVASKNAVPAEPFTPASSVHGDTTRDEEQAKQNTPFRNKYQKASVKDAADNDEQASEKTPTRGAKSPARQAPKRPDLKSNLSAMDTTAPEKSTSTGSAALPVPRAPQDSQTEHEKNSTTKVHPPYRPSIVEQTATQPRPVARKRTPEVTFIEPEKVVHSGTKKGVGSDASPSETPTKPSLRGRAASPSSLATTPAKGETVKRKDVTPLVKKDSQQGPFSSDVSPRSNTSKPASPLPSSKQSLLPQLASPSPKSKSPKPANNETSSPAFKPSPYRRPSTSSTALSQVPRAETPKATASMPANAWLTGMGNPMHIPALEPPETDAASIKTLLAEVNGNGNVGSTGGRQVSHQHALQPPSQLSVSSSLYSNDDTAVPKDTITSPKAAESPSASASASPAVDSTNNRPSVSPPISPLSRPTQQPQSQHERVGTPSSSTTTTNTEAGGRTGSERSETGSVHSGTTMTGSVTSPSGSDSLPLLAGAQQQDEDREDGNSGAGSGRRVSWSVNERRSDGYGGLKDGAGGKGKGGWRGLGARLGRKDTGGSGGAGAGAGGGKGVFGRRKTGEKGGSVG